MHLPSVQECICCISMIEFTPFSDIVAKIETGLSDKGLTVADLCRKAGIAQTTWGRWKGGKFEPRDKTKEQVIDAYNALVGNDAEAAA